MDRPTPASLDAARVARASAVWARRPELRTLELTGPDRARYLNGQVTQDVLRLAAGEGALAVKTSAKGRCEAYVRVRVAADAVYLDLRDVVADSAFAALERYIIMDDCEVRDVSAARSVLTVLGPQARATLARAGVEVPALAPHAWVVVDGVSCIEDSTLGLAGVELHGPPARIDALATALAETMEAPPDALEIVRVEEGVPIDGAELDLETIPLEAHLQHAISMSKGCYTGQEVIARATNLGGVNWSLVGLTVEGDRAPLVDAEMHAADEPDSGAKARGQLCTVVWSPLMSSWIALGFVRVAMQAPGTRLRAGDVPLTVHALPFRP